MLFCQHPKCTTTEFYIPVCENFIFMFHTLFLIENLARLYRIAGEGGYGDAEGG